MENLKLKLEIAVAVMNLVGVPVAIVLFFLNKRRERIEREYGTYNSLDEKYIDYLNLCVQHPTLDVFDVPLPNHDVSSEKQWQELQIFSILIAILERAYLMYRGKSRAVREAQWTGWEEYMKNWASRDNFKAAWESLKGQFDKGFEGYMDKLLSTSGESKVKR